MRFLAWTVMMRHVLRNALIPVITLAALHLDAQIGGSVILENIFGLPGVGQGIVQGASLRDYPVVQGLAMSLVFITLTINLLVDIPYGLIDPRIKCRSGRWGVSSFGAAKGPATKVQRY